jgi:polysaccharide deacetylase family protein (PEP-CTERM system associated)
MRLESSTRWLLDQLGLHGTKATFFVLGQIARQHPALVRAIQQDGHEVASHGWDHQRVHSLTPALFRHDVRRSKDVIEQIIGEAVVGYRAPTFSIVRETAWALDILAELGMLYDSSIYPVWHDRYGVPQAPRSPFQVRGINHALLELPLATVRFLGVNLPVGGGGYFRLLPLFLMESALRQIRLERPSNRQHFSLAVLYFHPWEFDPKQPRLPLRWLNRFRTYVGIFRNRGRFNALLARYRVARANDAVSQLEQHRSSLPSYSLM